VLVAFHARALKTPVKLVREKIPFTLRVKYSKNRRREVFSKNTGSFSLEKSSIVIIIFKLNKLI
jgi:hypothetical protein